VHIRERSRDRKLSRCAFRCQCCSRQWQNMTDSDQFVRAYVRYFALLETVVDRHLTSPAALSDSVADVSNSSTMIPVTLSDSSVNTLLFLAVL